MRFGASWVQVIKNIQSPCSPLLPDDLVKHRIACIDLTDVAPRRPRSVANAGDGQRRRRQDRRATQGSPIHGTSGRRPAGPEFIPRRNARRRWLPGLASHHASTNADQPNATGGRAREAPNGGCFAGASLFLPFQAEGNPRFAQGRPGGFCLSDSQNTVQPCHNRR